MYSALVLVILLLILLSINLIQSQSHPLPAVNYYPSSPIRGWSPADAFSGPGNELQLMEWAEYLLSSGLVAAGYNYITLDGSWWLMGNRTIPVIDQYGRYIPDPDAYPSGFNTITTKLHSMGIKLGIWILRGVPQLAVQQKLPIYRTGGVCTADMIANTTTTCTWIDNMNYGINTDITVNSNNTDNSTIIECGLAYYQSLAELYISLGLDLVKADCFYGEPEYRNEIEAFSTAVIQSNKQQNSNQQNNNLLLLSYSPGNNATIAEAEWLTSNNYQGYMYRITGDVWDYYWHILRAFDAAALHSKFINYNNTNTFIDLDILPFGFGYGNPAHDNNTDHYTDLTMEEQHSTMVLWCFARSPLIMGGAFPIDSITIELLTNYELLSISSNSMGNKELYRITNKYKQITDIVWIAYPNDNSIDSKSSIDFIYLALFNLANNTNDIDNNNNNNIGYRTVSIDLSILNLDSTINNWIIRDLFNHSIIGIYQSNQYFITKLKKHDVRVISISPAPANTNTNINHNNNNNNTIVIN